MIDKLLELQSNIYEYHNPEGQECYLEHCPRISFSKVGAFYEIIFYGEGYDNDSDNHSSEFEPGTLNYGFCALLDFLVENPDQIISLKFTGPDEGANGIRSWDFNRLINSDVVFKDLKVFKVSLTDTGDHNQSLIGEYDEEDGMIARLVTKMPNLEELELPSAPNQEFFELPKLKIKKLRIHAGYEHQNFISNLAQCDNLPDLKRLDYTEPFDHFQDLTEEDFTSFEAFKALFNSEIFSYEHFHFKLRENRLSQGQLEELQRIRKIQLLHIKTEVGQYIRI